MSLLTSNSKGSDLWILLNLGGSDLQKFQPRKSCGVWKSLLRTTPFFVILILVSLLFSFVLPEYAAANGNGGNRGGGLLEFPNPIESRTLEELIQKLATAARSLAFVLAPLFILISGFRFLTASFAGNASGLEKARKMFYWTLIGTAIVVGASVLAQAVINFARGL